MQLPRSLAGFVQSAQAALVALILASAAPAQSILPVNNGIPTGPAVQVFFTVQAKAEDVTICGFTAHFGADYSAFTCEDSELGPFSSYLTSYMVDVHVAPLGASESDSSAWSPAASTFKVSASPFAPAYIALANPLFLPAGEFRKVSFAAVKQGSGGCSASVSAGGVRVEEPIGLGIVENDDLAVYSGLSSPNTPLFSGGVDPAQLLGLVHYTLGSGPCETGELPVQLVPSTLYDGPEAGGVGPLVGGKVYAVNPGLFGWAEVPAGKTLTCEPGAVIVLGDGTNVASRINVKGTARFTGTVVTSVFDDEVGGDTDAQLGLTPRAPAPGDFEGVHFEASSTGSKWSGGLLRYGGSNAVLAALHLNGADVEVEQVTLSDNAAGNGFTVDANDKPGPSFHDNVIVESDGKAIGGVSFDMLSLFYGNLAAANALGDYLTLTGSTSLCPGAGPALVTKDVKVTPFNYPGSAVVMDGGVCIDAGARLEFAPGVRVKFVPDRNGAIRAQNGGQLLINGSANSPVTFSSLGNDLVGGDTDKDGVDTAQPGDLIGVRFSLGSSGFIRHAEIYDGGDLAPALVLQSSSVSADSVFVSDSANDGVSVSSLDGNLNDFFVERASLNGFRLSQSDVDGTPFSIINATVLDSGANGIRTTSGVFAGQVANTIVWNSGSGNFGLGLTSSNVSTSLGGFAGINGNLDEDPQLVQDGLYRVPTDASPVVDAGAPQAGLVADLRDGDRSTFGGTAALPDMGAVEASTTSFHASPFLIGGTLELTTESTTLTGAPVAYIGGLPSLLSIPGFGLIGYDLSLSIFFGVGFVGSDFQIAIPGPSPSTGSLAGKPFVLQGFTFAPTGVVTPTHFALSEFVSQSVLLTQ